MSLLRHQCQDSSLRRNVVMKNVFQLGLFKFLRSFHLGIIRRIFQLDLFKFPKLPRSFHLGIIQPFSHSILCSCALVLACKGVGRLSILL